MIKDRLYTLGSDDPLRRSTQSAILLIFESLLKLIGPFTPYIADEAWAFGQSGKEYGEDFLCLQEWPVPLELGSKRSIIDNVQYLLDLKDSQVNESLESLRVKKKLGSPRCRS